jgi:hypothetical protein
MRKNRSHVNCASASRDKFSNLTEPRQTPCKVQWQHEQPLEFMGFGRAEWVNITSISSF